MSKMNLEQYEIAAIIPCHNEETAIGKVVRDLRSSIPSMKCYVYDNNSSDQTAKVAYEAGAIVVFEPRKGKGNVVRSAFADIDADIYLMIDGDDTYDASQAREMVELLISENLDHVLGCRKQAIGESAYRPGHETGNKVFNKLVSKLFGEKVTDMLSGYRVFSRRFVKSFPSMSREFEIETELTVHAATLRVSQREVEVGFKDRPAGSESKLRTYHDGFKILSLICRLFMSERPVLFFGIFSGIIALISLILGIPLIIDFALTGLVPRFPTAILAASLMTIAVLVSFLGMIISSILTARQEHKRLVYLSHPSVRASGLIHC